MPTPFKWIADFVVPMGASGASDRNPWAIALPNGQFQIIATSGFATDTDPSIRAYNAGGTSVLGASSLESSSTISSDQAAGAVLTDGRRVYVWTQEPVPSAGDLRDVYAEVRFGNSATGTDSIAPFLVAGGAGNQFDPVVAAGAFGGFAIALKDANIAGGQLNVYFYNVAGTLVNTVAPANTTAGVLANEGRQVSITGLTNGNYVVAWGDGSPFETRARIYDSVGVAVTAEFTLDAGGGNDVSPVVTALADGRFVVVFADNSPPGESGNGFSGKIFNADGTIAVDTFGIGTGLDIGNRTPSVGALADGRFVVVWGESNGGNIDIVGQIMFADGTKDGADFIVNTATTGNQADPTVAVLADGRFVVTWTDEEPADDVIMATIFDPRETNINMSGSSYSDDLYGTSFNDAVYAGAGNDTVRGQGGADYILGEAGNDSLLGGDGGDLLYGGANNDNLQGEVGDDFLYGGVGDDTVSGGAGADIVYGEDGNDFLAGDDGNDTVIGGAGNDQMYGYANDDAMDGGLGADTMYGGTGNDFLRGGAGADVLIGEDGNDQLYGEDGDDSLDGGAGADTFYGGAGADFAQGGAGGDVLIGEAGNDDLRGGDDDDSIDGGADNDTLRGEAGNDFIQGGDGDDFIDGGSGTDDLRGGAGNDTIIGGAGGDTMYGNAGSDVFRFAVGSGADAIVGWEDGLDRIDISTYAGATFANTVITQVGGDTRVTFVGGDSVLLIGINAATITIADFIT